MGRTVLNRGNRKGTDGNTETGIYEIKDNSYGQQAVAVCDFIPSFRKETKGYVLSFGANERTKENIHLLQGLPLYWEDVIDYGQRPPYIKVLVCFTKPVP